MILSDVGIVTKEPNTTMLSVNIP